MNKTVTVQHLEVHKDGEEQDVMTTSGLVSRKPVALTVTSRKRHGLHVCDKKQKVHRIFAVILGGAVCYSNIQLFIQEGVYRRDKTLKQF